MKREDGANCRVEAMSAGGTELWATVNLRARALVTFAIIAQRGFLWDAQTRFTCAANVPGRSTRVGVCDNYTSSSDLCDWKNVRSLGGGLSRGGGTIVEQRRGYKWAWQACRRRKSKKVKMVDRWLRWGCGSVLLTWERHGTFEPRRRRRLEPVSYRCSVGTVWKSHYRDQMWTICLTFYKNNGGESL